jgi:hypothetical protein
MDHALGTFARSVDSNRERSSLNPSLLPSRSAIFPLKKPAAAALAYLEAMLRRQPQAATGWPSKETRLRGSITPERIVLRLGTRHRWVVFVGQVADDGRTIHGIFKVSLPERLLFGCWCALLGTVVTLGIVAGLAAQGSTRESSRFLAVALAMLPLGFFATRLSWLGRRAHVSWLANLIRRATQ